MSNFTSIRAEAKSTILLICLSFLLVAVFMLVTPSFASAADRYWVHNATSGTGNWSDTSHWSNSTHGSGGFSVPTSADNVYFDSNSFDAAGQIVSLTSTGYSRNLDWTGATNTPTFKTLGTVLAIYGNCTLITGMSLSYTGWGSFTWYGTGNFISAGHDIVAEMNGSVAVYTGGNLTLLDNLISVVSVSAGTLNTNNKSITCGWGGFTVTSASAKTINLGSSIITFTASTGTTGWDMETGGGAVTLDTGTSTINLYCTSAGTQPFKGGGKTYYNVNMWSHGSGGGVVVSGNNTFTNFSRVGGGQGISTYTITAGADQGTGYTAGDILTVVQSGAGVGTVRVLTVGGGGEVATSSLLSAGAGYSVANDLITTGGTGTGCLINITAVTAGSKIDTLTLTANTIQTITGNCTLLGSSAINRLLVQSGTLGTPTTLNVDGGWTGTNAVDFMDITSTHAVDLSSLVTYDKYTGDCQGNSGITFTTSSTQTSGSTATWSTAAKWTSRVPLPQDDVVCTNTTSVDMPRIGRSITFSGTPTITYTASVTSYGSWTNSVGMTFTVGGGTNQFRGRGAYNITSSGKTFYYITLWVHGGNITLLDNLVVSGDISHPYGGFIANNCNVTCRSYITWGVIARVLDMGNGIWTLSGTSPGQKWVIDLATASSLTFSSGSSLLVLTSSNTTVQGFEGGGKTYNNVTVQGAGNYTLTVIGSNTFNTFTVDRSLGNKTLVLTSSTSQTFTNFVCSSGSPWYLVVNSTTTTAAVFTKSGGDEILLDYLDLKYNTGSPASTWYYGSNSIIGANVTGWSTLGYPSGSTSAATSVGYTFSQLNGSITDMNGSIWTSAGFEYGTTVLYGSLTAPTTNMTALGSFYHNATSLSEGTTYHFRAIWSNTTLVTNGTDLTFTTYPRAPSGLTITTTSSTQLTLAWSAALGATNYYIRYSDSGPITSLSDGDWITTTAGLGYGHTSLAPATTYWYGVWSIASDGLTFSPTFATGSATTSAVSIYLDQFKYYMPITITSTCSTSYSDIRIPFIVNSAGLVSGGYCYSNFTDIVLARSDTIQPLTITDYTASTAYVISTADSGTNETLTDSALTQADDFWNGDTLTITSTTDDAAPYGETTTIADFFNVNDTLVFSSNLTASVDTGDGYTLSNYRSKWFTNLDLAAYQQVVLYLYMGNPSQTVRGQSLLDYAGDSIVVSSHADFNITTNLTLQSGYKSYGAVTTNAPLISKPSCYFLGVNATGYPYFTFVSTTNRTVSSNTSVLANDYYTIKGTYNNVTQYLYMNSTCVGQASLAVPIDTAATDITISKSSSSLTDNVIIGDTSIVSPHSVLILTFEAPNMGEVSIADMSGHAHTASATYNITLPSCITVEVGGVQESNLYTSPGSTTGTSNVTVLAQPTAIPGWFSNGTGSNMPFYPEVNAAATQLGWASATLYLILVVFTAIMVGTAVGVMSGSALITVFAIGFTLAAGASANVIGWWIVVIYFIFALAYVQVSRSM